MKHGESADRHVELAHKCILGGDFAAGERAARDALALDPDHLGAVRQLSNALIYQGRIEEVIPLLRRILAAKPDDATVALNLGMALLTLGRYAEGWQYYESRFETAHFEKGSGGMDYPQRPWRGGDISGKTLLIHAEQGIGDTFQFARFIPVLEQKGAKVIVRVDSRLVPLLQYSFPGAAVVPIDQPAPAFDEWVPFLSLGASLGVTLESLPANVPYLKVKPQRRAEWRNWLGPRSESLKVGLIWAGNPQHADDARRSLKLEMLAPVASVPNVQLYSLQFGPPAAQAKQLDAFDIVTLGDAIAPFTNFAALLCELDLLLTVDTAAAHLAGALGAPCWVLLAANADWRWLLHRADSPWYPSVRLFRQATPNDWSAPIEEAARALLARVREARAIPSPEQTR